MTTLIRSKLPSPGAVSNRVLVVGTLLVGITLSIPQGGVAYVEGPPPERTGAFGERSCLECHFDGPLNDPGGSLNFSAVPDNYTPGKEYRIDIVLARADLRRGGFELAVRFREGPEAGRQAGSLSPIDDKVDVVSGEDASVQYARQNESGSLPESGASLTWSVRWLAPRTAHGPVAFNVAANAANDDASELGDWIYMHEALIPEG